MDQMTTNQTEKQGWMMRLVTAVAQKLLAHLCTYQMGMGPCETQMFLHYSGLGMEKAMISQSLARMKWDEEVQP